MSENISHLHTVVLDNSFEDLDAQIQLWDPFDRLSEFLKLLIYLSTNEGLKSEKKVLNS